MRLLIEYGNITVPDRVKEQFDVVISLEGTHEEVMENLPDDEFDIYLYAPHLPLILEYIDGLEEKEVYPMLKELVGNLFMVVDYHSLLIDLPKYIKSGVSLVAPFGFTIEVELIEVKNAKTEN